MSKKSKKGKKRIPIPEALNMPRGGRGWEVESCESGEGRTNLMNRHMIAPTGSSDQDHFVRLHEMAHANWSPPVVDAAAAGGVKPDTLQVVEDARMQIRLEQADVEDLKERVWREDHESHAEMLIDGSVSAVDCARRAMSFVSTGDYDKHREVVEQVLAAAEENEIDETRQSHLREALRIGEFVKGQFDRKWKPKFDETLRVSRAAQHLLNSLQEDEEKDQDSDSEGEDGDGLPSETEMMEAADDTDEMCDDKDGDGAPGESGKSDGSDVWGPMNIDTPTRKINTPGRFHSRQRRAADSGHLTRNMHRYAIDGAVFDRKSMKVARPSVLIDCSGSMHLSPQQIQQYAETFPFATVATYSGGSWVCPKIGKTGGVLRIVIKNGRRVDDCWLHAPGGGGNIIDGPALEWLGQQPEPRVWVSDGIVTGPGDGHGPRQIADAIRICKRYRIRRADNAAVGFELLNTGKLKNTGGGRVTQRLKQKAAHKAAYAAMDKEDAKTRERVAKSFTEAAR